MNFVLITWAMFGGLFIYAFLANFRTMLLKPQYEAPVDSAQDILDRGLIPFVQYGGYLDRDHLLQSPNPAYQKLGAILYVPETFTDFRRLREEIQGKNSHVFLGGDIDWAAWLFGKSFHESKEVIEGKNYFGGDIINKKWSLGEQYSYHLLVFQQVEIYLFFAFVLFLSSILFRRE